jgi:signal transduction histidine kinase
VAQEALTNTLKHATRPVTARLVLRCEPDRVSLEVTDTGGPVAAEADQPGNPLPSGGRGLRGMRERAAAFGGELEAGPRPEGGWRVALTIAPEPAPVGGPAKHR